MYLVEFKSQDNHLFQCNIETNDLDKIGSLAFEKLKSSIEDYISFNYKIFKITDQTTKKTVRIINE